MNGLEIIQESIKNFICEKKQIQQQISEIEEKRTQLAQQRNYKKQFCENTEEVNELGRQISELGKQSQELQNKLDFKFHGIKTQINLMIDNLVAEGIRKIRKIGEEIQQLENKIEEQKERNEKYQLQKQEFYVRFGRMPELSERAIKESKLQEKETIKSELEISQLKEQIKEIEEEITVLAKTKREVKNGNWNNIVDNESNNEEVYIEELNVEEMEPIAEIIVEEFGPIEELYIEEFQPVEEMNIEELETEENAKELVNTIEEKDIIDEIEELAKAIVEEIVAEQTERNNVIEELVSVENAIEDDSEEEIIVFEKENDTEEIEKKGKVVIPLFGQKATISNITVKFEIGELVYKAQMSDGEEIKIYPAKLGEESVLLRDKQNREECKEILINYAASEYKVFDKKVITKIDPLVCELLIECAERYSYDAQELIYNYAMSFSDGDLESVPEIIYNLSYFEQSNLSKKEKVIINKICKNARKNDGIEIIESFSGFRKIKYIFKRLFAVNNVKVLPEAKY